MRERGHRARFEAFLERELSRRALLAQVLRGGAALTATSLLGAACGDADDSMGARDAAVPSGGDAGNDAGTDAGTDADATDAGAGTPDAATPSHLVGLARAETRGLAIERAVALAGGLGFVASGDSVLLKPNCNSGDPYPWSTHPDTVRALVTMLRGRGAGRIVMGDRSFWGSSTADNMRANGLYGLGEELDIEVLDWDAEDPADWIDVPADTAPDWGPARGFRFPRILSEVDHILSLPVVKTHSLAYFTMGLKNWIGITSAGTRRSGLDHSMPALARSIAQVHTAVTPSLLVLDGTQAVVQGGPRPIDPPGPLVRDAGIVVASRDRVALDVTGVAILKLLDSPSPQISSRGVWEQPQIVAALERGLGIAGPGAYDVAGDGVDELDAIRALVVG